MATKYYWIKERINPQFKKPYYVGMGAMTMKEAKKIEDDCLYGYNNMIKFPSECKYLEALERFGLKNG
jgi:hypothetical protein